MVAAYLRGLLKPEPAYGLRSCLAEDVILEALAAEVAASSMDLSVLVSAATLSLLKREGVRDTMKTIGNRMVRCSELRLMDLYRMDRARMIAEGFATNKNTPSLLQLYKLAEKSGMFDALRAHDPLPDEVPETD